MASTAYHEIILFFQEPFIEVEAAPRSESILDQPSFCRYAIVLGNCTDSRHFKDQLLRYPVCFIPTIISSLASHYQPIFGIWLLLYEPEVRQCFAFKATSFFGSLLYTPSKRSSFPDALLAFLPDSGAVRTFAKQVGWPSLEQMWVAVGVRNAETPLNIRLLQACQQQNYPIILEAFEVGRAFSFEFYAQKTNKLLNQDAYFIAYMDHIRTFGPFFFTCDPVRNHLREAIQEYYSHPLNRWELCASEKDEIKIQEKQLDSYEYWRQLL